MTCRKHKVLHGIALTVAMAAVCSLGLWGQTYRVIHNFNLSTGDGAAPDAGLAFDSHGNLFGTTFAGGTPNGCGTGYTCGTVFELSPDGSGGWNERIIQNLSSVNAHPGAPVTIDSHGNIYGTGGGFNGYGAVFALLLGANGSYTQEILHQFRANGDGAGPGSGLTLDSSSGFLYGTTGEGGEYNDGTVYSVNPHSISGLALLHSFTPNVTSGNAPSSTYLQLINGSIYGTTLSGGPGGPFGFGTIFQLTRSGSGWTATTLYSFKGAAHGDGARPVAGLLPDGAGNFYGVTSSGGTGCAPSGCGTVFKLTHNSDGTWSESVLYSFQNGLDGNSPWGNLIFDASGNILGTTYAGGELHAYGNGTVFKLTRGAGGQWTESIVARLPGGAGGSIIDGGVVIDSAGNIYGTAQNDGAYGGGVVFEITP